MKKNRKTQHKYHEPFSPAILETTVPQKFVDIINRIGDEVLSDDVKRAKWDWSHKLVGKVSKEIQIPVTDKDDKEFLARVMKQGCLDYLNHIIKRKRAYGWFKLAGREAKPSLENIHLTQSWIVSQYAGEYNPWHHHNGDFSAGIYLKVPDVMNDEGEEEFQDHYPSNGLIEFMYGENQDMRTDNAKFKPEVGKFLVFPSYLRHFVYPFHCEGERRMMSFNAHMRVQ